MELYLFQISQNKVESCVNKKLVAVIPLTCAIRITGAVPADKVRTSKVENKTLFPLEKTVPVGTVEPSVPKIKTQPEVLKSCFLIKLRKLTMLSNELPVEVFIYCARYVACCCSHN